MKRSALALAAALALAGCSTDNGSDQPAATKKTEVVIATHDSWNAPKGLIKKFERESGYQVTILPSGDAGELTNKLVLTKGSPIADGVYGVDNTFASRAIDENVFAIYHSGVLPEGEFDLEEGSEFLTPVDQSDVCVNIDDEWFAREKLAPPATLEDLADPKYKDLFVTPGAATSSPGLAFLLATIGEYGDQWSDYWTRLMDNGAKLAADWEDAYYVDFTQGGGDGARPIVLSYASSPPFTIPKGEKRPTTSALLDTCFRQVEYAGVLDDASNPEGARAFIDFLVSRQFQEALPDNMYVFPVDPEAQLPELWAAWAKPSPEPIDVDPADIAEHRAEWLTEWSDLTSR
ncbi:MAG TPA: thiamine ABC transporter substrate-binding protein [Nocardioidaceae bacterium]|nr:thiamine ABC transporter substrate-binding protein [Nocardioidaceae bacterium]